MNVVALDTDWEPRAVVKGLDGCFFWQFDLPTRVEGFEIENPSGFLRSIRIGNEEQILGPELPLRSVVTEYRKDYFNNSPSAGFKIVGLILPTVQLGVRLQVHISSFRGRIRPFGVQSRG